MKMITRGFIALLFCSLLLSGCSKQEPQPAPPSPAQAQQSPAPQPAPAPAQPEPSKAPVAAPSPSEKKAPVAAPKTPATPQPAQPTSVPAPAAPPAVEPARPAPLPAPVKPLESAPAKPAETPAPSKPPAPAQAAKLPSKDTFILKATLGGVKFEHKKHATERAPSCDVCHHTSRPEKPAVAPQVACSTCHTFVAAPPMKTKLQAAFHNPTAMQGTCIDCHKAQNAQGKKAPVKCLDCHKKENS